MDALRDQFNAYPAEAYLVEVEDTGHWSFADDCGLIADFQDGCGRGARQRFPYESFEFLDNKLARETAAHYLNRFFGGRLLGVSTGAWSDDVQPHTQVMQHHPKSQG